MSFTSDNAYKMIVDEEKETRSSEQNRKMWAMLGEIADQLQINGQSFDKDRWKAIMLHAWGEQVEFLPTLDGTSFFPYGHQTSKLSTKKMSVVSGIHHRGGDACAALNSPMIRLTI